MVLEQYRLMKSVPNLTYDVNFLVTNESGMFLNSIGTFFINKLNALKNFFQDETKIFNLKQDQFIEDMLIDYKSHIKQQGIVNYYFDQQLEDDFAQDFRDIVSILTLDYIVLTEKNRVIFRENTKSILLRGEALNEDGSPITATGEVYTDDEEKRFIRNNTKITKK